MTNKAILQVIISILSMLAIGQSAISAQTAGTGAIVCSTADTLSDIWFRHTYITLRRPISGNLTISATGRYKVFINESNITPIITETIKIADTTTENSSAITATIDITRYLRNDSNTIAILYHPKSLAIADQSIYANYYGIERNGKPFTHTTDSGWLCRTTPRNGNDRTDRGYTQSVATACWIPAVAYNRPQLALSYAAEHPLTPTMQPNKIITPRYSEHVSGGNEYEFGIGFYGYIRLTLRGTHAGDTININGYSRICRGETDEQISTWAEPTYYRRIRITGSSGFKTSSIQHIEGICLKPSQRLLPTPLNKL